MKFNIPIILFAMALVLGCSSDSSEISNTENLVSNTNQLGPERPFRVSGSGTFEAVQPDGFCSPSLPLQIALEGSGNATHVGLFTVELTWCFLPPSGPLYLSGTIFAANGDELYIETVGQGANSEGEVYETFIFLGGTGRFEEATGQFDLYTVTDFEANCFCGTYSNQGEGFISY